jgi:hypothetical protein
MEAELDCKLQSNSRYPAPDCARGNVQDDAVRHAFGRVNSWRTPPHWSTHDWLAELQAILQVAAASANSDYDEDHGVPLPAQSTRPTAAAPHVISSRCPVALAAR